MSPYSKIERPPTTIIMAVVGFLLQFTGSYVPVFLMAGFAYLVALAAIHLLVPTLEPAGL